MEIQRHLREGSVVIILTKVLVAKKAILKQLPIKDRWTEAEFEKIVPLGWVDGPTLVRDWYTRVGLYELNGQPYLVKLNPSWVPQPLLEEFDKAEQIILE